MSLAPDALVVTQCSKLKRKGGDHARSVSVLDLLPNDLSHALERAREQVSIPARIDEAHLLPAWQRYTGYLYAAAADALGTAVNTGREIAIISGGYGVVLGAECIGTYEREFHLSDWPRGLLENCMLAVAQASRHLSVVAFCARTTGYATLIRRTGWSTRGINAVLVTPRVGSRGGAQRVVPRMLGDALAAYLLGHPTTAMPGAASLGEEELK